MPASGSSIFTDADSYQASLQDMLHLLVLRPSEFHARLTWVELPALRLVQAQETSARTAYVVLSPDRVFVSFVTRKDSLLICDGTKLQFGDLVFHGLGERLHQRTTAASQWGLISMTPATMMAFGTTIADHSLRPPAAARIHRPLPADRRRLLLLHARAGRIAETNLDRIRHREVARALEQDLILAVITCLATGAVQEDRPIRHQHGGILVRFEEALTAYPDRRLTLPEICGAIGVSQHMLRTCCLELLGMDPARYLHLRNLERIRLALLRTDTIPEGTTEVTKRYGFADPSDSSRRTECLRRIPVHQTIRRYCEYSTVAHCNASISDFA